MARAPSVTTRIRLGWAAAHALFFFCAFPQWLFGGPFDAGFLFAWLVPATLLLVCDDRSPRAGALWGGLAGWLAHLALLHWVFVAAVTYGHAHPLLGAGAVALLAVYGALFSALFGAIAAWLPGRRASTPLVLAACWVVLDALRSVVLTGFPWGTLGYALHADEWARAWAPYTGVYGLSFLAALGGVALRDLWGRRLLRAGSWILAVVVLHGVGGLLRGQSADPGETLRVGIVQGNIDQGVKWRPDWAERTLANYEEGTREAAAQGARLVVWPETAVPGLPEANPELAGRLEALASETGVILVAGAVGIDGVDPNTGQATGPLKVYDSAFLFDDEGMRDRYDKAHLVPFGEYIPLRSLFGEFVSAVASGATSSDLTPGPGARAFRIADRQGQEFSIGASICYELLFPALVRGFTRDGASLLTAMTNDAWYGRTGAPLQFLVITALRAAGERTLDGARANTGVSALIDPSGEVVAETGLFERRVLVGDVIVRSPAWPATFYARFGDVFVLGCVGVLLLMWLRVLSRRFLRTDGTGKKLSSEERESI